MITLKRPHEVELMREAGRVVVKALAELSGSIVPGKTTPKDLDALADRIITDAGGRPSFKGFKGYPAATCISRNDVVIHGIPDDVPLEEGDIVGIDLGVHLNGYHADRGWTYPVGTISKDAARLLAVTRESLYQGIAKAKVGNRLGDVGAAIQRYVESNGYGVVRELVGHGIGRNLHEEPAVPNYGKPGKGLPLREGMVICIEPMVNQGTAKVVTLKDGWTVKTADGKLSAHFEHTVFIGRDGPEILTPE